MSVEPSDSSGRVDYDAYIQSEKWRRFRARYFRFSGRPTECLICGYSDVQLHHITYANLGNETYDDVVPLCQEHHSAIHEAHAKYGIPLENFEEARKRAMLGCYKAKKAKARKRKIREPKKEIHPVQAMHKGTWKLINDSYRAHLQAVQANTAGLTEADRADRERREHEAREAARREIERKRRLGVIN